jgi:hypothetical protein
MLKHVGIIAFTAIVAASSIEAIARSTGWVNGYEWLRISKTLTKNGEMPVSVVCKDSNNRGLSFQSGLAKIEIHQNTGNIAWYWAFGARVNQVKGRMENRGYKVVSYSEYRRASGLKVPCAIWHKVD